MVIGFGKRFHTPPNQPPPPNHWKKFNQKFIQRTYIITYPGMEHAKKQQRNGIGEESGGGMKWG